MDSALADYEKYETALWQYESQYKALDSQTKTVLAENYGTEGSVKERENAAYTSEAYKTHKLALDLAQERFFKCRSFRDFYRVKWEHERTKEASMRKLQ